MNIFFFKVVKNNINYAIQYCKKFKLQINNFYKNKYYQLDSLNLKKVCFQIIILIIIN